MAESDFDAIIVGAGFAGLYMLHKLRGLGLSAHIYEAGEDVGGTWFWNRYPGARCDVESMEYSYSFDQELEQEWRWTERYAPQPEILSYIRHVAERFDLRRDISFATRVVSADFDEGSGLWSVATDAGETRRARFCIMATGCLSTPNRPDIPGLDSFAGGVYMTGQWPHQGVDFSGHKVAVIGTGSSGIQSIPAIAKQAAHTTVFQRTANYIAPARNHPMTQEYEADFRANYRSRRKEALQTFLGIGTRGEPAHVPAMSVSKEERNALYEDGWRRGGLGVLGSFPDLLVDREANETLAEFVRGKTLERVNDPAVADLLCPRDYPVGSKRMCIDTDYFETFNRDDVDLVDLNAEPIERITANGLVTAKRQVALDAIVLATGFDAMTGTLAKIAIAGRGGQRLGEAWADGPHTYLGLAVAGFPNLFMITGPGSPSVFSNMLVSIEQHVDWIGQCLADLRARGADTIEVLPQAQEAWDEHSAAVAAPTVCPDALSWYTGANVPGKPRGFMVYLGGVPSYRAICDAVARDGYRGFAIDGVASAPPGDFAALMVPPEMEPA
jgi:cyclohexanone monooxygenase